MSELKSNNSNRSHLDKYVLNIYHDLDLFKKVLLDHLRRFELAETITAEDKKMEARIKKVIEDLDPEKTIQVLVFVCFKNEDCPVNLDF